MTDTPTPGWKPLLCLDFDGVLHSFVSGWVEIDFIPDPPVRGAMEFLLRAFGDFEVCIFSSRSRTPEGRRAMASWLRYWAFKTLTDGQARTIESCIGGAENEKAWPTAKPAAFLTIDDRAVTFAGIWPDIAELRKFKSWNKP